ncbi:hypothetical protein PAPHI01_1259 [Pancytospora philotis]|nr:hypothetical protein PAPHI01_1259 [Pancytospora philotis]
MKHATVQNADASDRVALQQIHDGFAGSISDVERVARMLDFFSYPYQNSDCSCVEELDLEALLCTRKLLDWFIRHCENTSTWQLRTSGSIYGHRCPDYSKAARLFFAKTEEVVADVKKMRVNCKANGDRRFLSARNLFLLLVVKADWDCRNVASAFHELFNDLIADCVSYWFVTEYIQPFVNEILDLISLDAPARTLIARELIKLMTAYGDGKEIRFFERDELKSVFSQALLTLDEEDLEGFVERHGARYFAGSDCILGIIPQKYHGALGDSVDQSTTVRAFFQNMWAANYNALPTKINHMLWALFREDSRHWESRGVYKKLYAVLTNEQLHDVFVLCLPHSRRHNSYFIMLGPERLRNFRQFLVDYLKLRGGVPRSSEKRYRTQKMLGKINKLIR